MKEKITLFELLTSKEREFYLSKKLEIYTISPTYLKDGLIYIIEEYFIDEIPYCLLTKEVIKALYYENKIDIFIK